ncbi:hypothetical protein CBFG_00693 [Clostridiales bacterium 1_7_47FAA]|nr:hypothetical protein CBFG_00693 [Clostridiales bacterium 1_7_47FAA]
MKTGHSCRKAVSQSYRGFAFPQCGRKASQLYMNIRPALQYEAGFCCPDMTEGMMRRWISLRWKCSQKP